MLSTEFSRYIEESIIDINVSNCENYGDYEACVNEAHYSDTTPPLYVNYGDNAPYFLMKGRRK